MNTKFISPCTVADGIMNEEFKEIDRRAQRNWAGSKDGSPSKDLVEFDVKLF